MSYSDYIIGRKLTENDSPFYVLIQAGMEEPKM